MLHSLLSYGDNLHYEKFADGSVKCIEDEIPFELPDGWEWSRLTSICSLISDIDHKMPKAVDDGVLFLSAKDLLNDGTINYTDDVKMISEEDFLRLSRKALPQKNDIVYSRIGACLGKARVVTKDIRFIVSYSCCTIRPVIIDSTFLALILDGDFVLDQAKEGTQSVGVPDLGMTSIKQFLIPIPPLVEQQRIDKRLQYALNIVQQISTERDDLSLAVAQAKSKILDLAIRGQLVPQDPNDEPASVLLERIRAEKEELIKQGKIKRDKKKSVIFRGEDNSYYEKIGAEIRCIDSEIAFEIPDGWTYERLGNICSVARGGSPRPIEDFLTDAENGLNWIKIGDTEQGGKYIFSTKERIRPDGLSKTRYVHCGDFLLTNSMSFGRPYILKTDGCIHDGWLVIGDVETVFYQDFLYYMLSSSAMYNALSSLAVGSTVKNLKSDSVKSLIVPIPPIGEQKLIADRVGMLFAVVIVIEKSLN